MFLLAEILFPLLLVIHAHADTGRLHGSVRDSRTLMPLTGVNVEVLETGLGASTDLEGHFFLEQVPVGVRKLKVSMIGYEARFLPDLVVRPEHSDAIEIMLEPGNLELETITVRPSYFSEDQATGSVTRQFHREEIRRAPGSAEDVNRVMQALPSVGMGGMDERNDLIVRGGNPMENLFLVDGHPVHNINHFGSQGSTGGPIGMIHVDFIDDVRFSPGGFDARYGDRLSSVMDIRFRDGSREQLGGEAFLSMAGLGAEFEGPIQEGRGSWLMGIRRSYLELLKDQIGYATAPVMGDFGGKVSYDLSARHRLEMLWLSGWNRTRWSVEQDPDQNYNVDQTQFSVASGFLLSRLRGPGGVDRFRLTLNHQDFDQAFSLWNGSNDIRNDAGESTLSIEAERLLLGKRADLRLALGAEKAFTTHDVMLRDLSSYYGDPRPDVDLDLQHEQYRSWVMVQSSFRLPNASELQFGLRLDHNHPTGKTDTQPRLSVKHKLSDEVSWTIAAGQYAQSVPVYWLVQSEENNDLESMKSRHLQTGLEWHPASDLMLSLDMYHRTYLDMPVSEYSPEMPLADVGASYGYANLGRLSSDGEGRSYGVELFAQKKLSGKFYGSFSWSWSLSRYKTTIGEWVPGPFDRRHMSTIIVGWLPSSKWEFSLKWRIMGGIPTTPIDAAASQELGDSVYIRDQYLESRGPVYHRLDLRADHRLSWRSWDIVMYWDIENAYDKQNAAFNYWHQTDGEVKTWYGWRIMPVFGITIEF